MTHLESLRLYLSHLLAATIKENHPGALLGAGGTTEVGFYYDTQLPVTIGTSDLEELQERMRRHLTSQKAMKVEPIGFDILRHKLQETGERLRLQVLPEGQELFLIETEG